MKLTKHIGHEKATNARITLIMTVLPDTEDCLVVYNDRLPPDIKEAFYEILNSDEGQREQNLAEALSRRLYSDTRTSMLQTLHTFKFITKLPIDNVVMTPATPYAIPLRDVLVQSGIIKAGIPAGTEKFNPHAYNANAANVGEVMGTATNLLAEAEMLEQAARQKRDQAYGLAPSLRPGYIAPEVESVDFPNNPALKTTETEVPTETSTVDVISDFMGPETE